MVTCFVFHNDSLSNTGVTVLCSLFVAHSFQLQTKFILQGHKQIIGLRPLGDGGGRTRCPPPWIRLGIVCVFVNTMMG